MRIRPFPRLSRVLALALGVAAPVAAAPGVAAGADTVTVFAAASLKNALDEVAAAFTAATGTRVTASYAASSALARQIEAAAPADIFFPADAEWMDYLVERGLIDAASRVDLLGNRIVLIAPAASPVALAVGPGMALRPALGDGRLAMASTAAVPAGRYGKAALTNLGVWEEVADRLVEAENVRGALAFVAEGEAPLGIVYATDAAAEPKVKVVGAFPEETHPPIVYPAALLAGSENQAAADFLAFLQTAEAAALFARHGFTAPAPGR